MSSPHGAVLIRPRTVSTTEFDIASVICQKLAISRDQIEVTKTAGGDFIVKTSSYEITVKIKQELRVRHWQIKDHHHHHGHLIPIVPAHKRASVIEPAFPSWLVHGDNAPAVITISYCYDIWRFKKKVKGDTLCKQIDKNMTGCSVTKYIVRVINNFETYYVPERKNESSTTIVDNKVVTIDVRSSIETEKLHFEEKFAKAICYWIYKTALALNDDYCMILIYNLVRSQYIPSPEDNLFGDLDDEEDLES